MNFSKVSSVKMILLFLISFVPCLTAYCMAECLGDGNWEFIDEVKGNFRGSMDGGKDETVKLFYLKEEGPFTEYGRNVAAITLNTINGDCLAVRYGYFTGKQIPNITELIRTNSEVPHQKSKISVHNLTLNKDIIQVNSIRASEVYQSASLFYFDDEENKLSEVWSGEIGCNCLGASDQAPLILKFNDINKDGYNDFSLIPAIMETDLVVDNNSVKHWLWNPSFKRYTRYYKDKDDNQITWELIDDDKDNNRYACMYENFNKSFCVWVSVQTNEIIDWKMKNENLGVLKYLSFDYGTKESYLVVNISIIDINKKVLLDNNECARVILRSAYENALIGPDENVLDDCNFQNIFIDEY
jgi:hypothetical protein